MADRDVVVAVVDEYDTARDRRGEECGRVNASAAGKLCRTKTTIMSVTMDRRGRTPLLCELWTERLIFFGP